jgi:antitoxin HicB
MTTKAMQAKSIHSGSSFDDFLEEEGLWEEVEAIAVKRVLAWQLSEAMKEQQKTKQAMARELQTSRSQLDRLLDPQNTTVSLETITRAATVLGKRVIFRIADVPTGRRRKTSTRRKSATRAVVPTVVLRRQSNGSMNKSREAAS